MASWGVRLTCLDCKNATTSRYLVSLKIPLQSQDNFHCISAPPSPRLQISSSCDQNAIPSGGHVLWWAEYIEDRKKRAASFHFSTFLVKFDGRLRQIVWQGAIATTYTKQVLRAFDVHNCFYQWLVGTLPLETKLKFISVWKGRTKETKKVKCSNI